MDDNTDTGNSVTTPEVPTTTKEPSQAQKQISDFNINKLKPPTKLQKEVPASPERDKNDLKAKDSSTPSITDNLGDAPSNIKNGVSDLYDTAKQMGGLAVAVAVLILLIWILIPTKSGNTRAQLIWYTLIGRAHLPETLTSTTSAPPTQPVSQTTGSTGSGPSSEQVDQTNNGLYIDDTVFLNNLSGMF